MPIASSSPPQATFGPGPAAGVSVRLEHLTKSFGPVTALHDISLAVAPSEMLVLVGPSGCGKTTCLRCLAGLERPTGGRIVIGERSVFSESENIFVNPERRRIGMVFQSYAVWPHMTVFENVAYPLRAMGLARGEIGPRVTQALKLVQLDALADRYSSQLSGGQQQRVALARSLVAEPALLLFDEPLSNLDANLRVQMRLEIRQLQKRLGFTGVYVTHDQAEALAIADRVAVMQAGRLMQIGSPRDIYDHPASAFVASFMGATNLMKATVESAGGGETALVVEGGLRLRVPEAGYSAGEAVTVSVRPETLALKRSGEPATEGAWPGEIAFSTFIGDTVIYHVRVGPHVLEVRESPHIIHENGSAVLVVPDPRRCRILRERG